MSDFNITTPRFFSDERVYSLDSDHKVIWHYCISGLQACSLSETGIYKIGRGEIAIGANVDMAKTEQVIAYFDREEPELMEYDVKNHIIFIKSIVKYKLRYGYLKKGSSLLGAVQKDFKNTGKKASKFWTEFAILYSTELEESIKMISPKDNNFSSYKKTYELLMSLRDEFIRKNSKPASIDKIKQTISVLEQRVEI